MRFIAKKRNPLSIIADYTVEGVVGHDLVQSWGGEVKLAQIVDGYSTTAAIARMIEKA